MWKWVTVNFNVIVLKVLARVEVEPSQRLSTQPKARLKVKKRGPIHMGAVKFNMKIIVKLKVLNIFPDDPKICLYKLNNW